MGMLTRRVNGPGATIGLIVGFGVNLLLWKYAPKISWLWWNVIGFFIAYAIGYLISLAFPKPDRAKLEGTLVQRLRGSLSAHQINWRPYYVTLALYGTGILTFLMIITYG
jgi:SSS family solute:Na+ symporter